MAEVITSQDTSIVVSNTVLDTTILVSEVANSITTLASQAQGPPGRDGASGKSIAQLTASTNLSGHIGVKLVNGMLEVVNNQDLTSAGKLVGITVTAVSALAQVEVIFGGELLGFVGLIPDAKLYLQSNGTISSTFPTTGYVQQVGIAISSTSALINIQPPIILG